MVVYTRQQHVLRSIEGYWRHFYVSEKEAGIVEQKKKKRGRNRSERRNIRKEKRKSLNQSTSWTTHSITHTSLFLHLSSLFFFLISASISRGKKREMITTQRGQNCQIQLSTLVCYDFFHTLLLVAIVVVGVAARVVVLAIFWALQLIW